MLTITPYNYEQYKRVTKLIFAFLTPPGPDPHVDPLAVLDRWEATHPDRAGKALKMGLLDAINSLREATHEQKQSLHELLVAEGLPGLFSLLDNVWDVREKVVKKQRISNMDEYFIIADLLGDVDAEMDEPTRNALEKMVHDWESSKLHRGK